MLVLDASAAVMTIVEEPGSDAVDRLMSQQAAIAPDLVMAEVANALWRKVRVGALGPSDVAGVLDEAAQGPSPGSCPWRRSARGRWTSRCAGTIRSTAALSSRWRCVRRCRRSPRTGGWRRASRGMWNCAWWGEAVGEEATREGTP